MRGEDGLGPVESIFHVGGLVAIGVIRPHLDIFLLAVAAVGTDQDAPIVAGVGDVLVGLVHGHVAGFAPADDGPVLRADASAVAARGHAHGRIVLLRAVDVVREQVVRDDVVELRGGLGVLARPGLAAVHGDGGAAIVGIDHPLRIGGINPQAVVVAVGNARDRRPGFPRVNGAEDGGVQGVGHVGALRIRNDMGVIPGAAAHAVVVGGVRPVLAAVIGAIDAAEFFESFDDGVDAIGVGGGNAHADAAESGLGPAVALDFLPGGACVGGFVERAARAAAGEAPGGAVGLPEGGEEDARVRAVHGEVDGTCVVAHEEHLFPVLPAVG